MTATPTTYPGPGWITGFHRQGAIDRETLWYDHALGAPQPHPAPWVLRGERGNPAQPTPTPLTHYLAAPTQKQPWPKHTWDPARDTPFPHHGSTTTLTALAAHALSVVRRDPSDPFNDHRGYPSSRCVFPVTGSVVSDEQWHVLDPERRCLVGTGVTPSVHYRSGAIALSGNYDRIPSSYGWFRGSLVGIEKGILLRHIAALSKLHNLELDIHLPGTTWAEEPEAAMWEQPTWSPPVVLTERGHTSTERQNTGGHASPEKARPHAEDSWPDLLGIYRSHTFTRRSGPLPTGVPEGIEGMDVGSWADVLWRRSAGRMPRGLFGFRVANSPAASEQAQAIAKWGAQKPPSPIDAAAGDLQVHAVVRDVQGLSPGIYNVINGQLTPRATAPPDALTRFASSYLYQSDVASSNEISRAPLVFVVTSRPRQAVSASGPSAWTALQMAAGWMAHGLCLGAAAAQLVARPVRAMDERDVEAALDLGDEQMVNIAVIVSRHHPHGGLQIDLRS